MHDDLRCRLFFGFRHGRGDTERLIEFDHCQEAWFDELLQLMTSKKGARMIRNSATTYLPLTKASAKVRP